MYEQLNLFVDQLCEFSLPANSPHTHSAAQFMRIPLNMPQNAATIAACSQWTNIMFAAADFKNYYDYLSTSVYFLLPIQIYQ